jgi:glycosyltransferase involved in cell wall biosynthesis
MPKTQIQTQHACTVAFFVDMSHRPNGWTLGSNGAAMSGTDFALLEVARHFAHHHAAQLLVTSVPTDGPIDEGLGVTLVSDFAEAVRRARVDGIHSLVFNAKPNSTQLEPLLTLEGPIPDLIAWCHNTPRLDWLRLARKLQPLKRIVCVSHLQALDLIQSAVFAKAVVIPHFLDFEDWGTTLRPEPTTLAYVGALKPEKGFQHLARTWPMLKAAVPEARLFVCGSPGLYGHGNPLGPEIVAEQEFEQQILEPLGGTRESAGALGVHFMGSVPKAELKVILAGAQAVVVNPNYDRSFETFCISALEANALERPVLGGYAGSLPEVVGHNRGGLLHRNDEEFLRHLTKLLKDPVLAVRLGQQGRVYAEEHYTRAAAITRWESLLLGGDLKPLRPRFSGEKPGRFWIKFAAAKLLRPDLIETIQTIRRR